MNIILLILLNQVGNAKGFNFKEGAGVVLPIVGLRSRCAMFTCESGHDSTQCQRDLHATTVVCQYDSDIYEHDNETSPAYFKAFQYVSRLVLSSSMEQMVIVTDNTADHECTYDFIANITESTPVSMVFPAVHSFIHITRQIMESVLQKQNTDVYWKNLNFVVIATSSYINDVIQTVHQLDAEVGRGCLLRHFSRWILVPTDSYVELISTSDIVFDHINLITKDPSYLTGCVPEELSVLSLFWELRGRVWKTNREFITQPLSAFPNTRHRLNGRILEVASLEWIPYSKREVINGEVIFTGVCGEILNRLATVFNFSIHYVEPPDNQWGEEVNSTWTGIVGMLQRKEVDMCGVPYVINIERNKVMTYSYPFMFSYKSAVYKKSVDEDRSWGVLTSCFKWEVYVCGLFITLTVCILFSVFEKANPSRSRPLSTSEIAMLGVMVPLYQANTATPPSTPSRVLLSFWWMFCIVITSVYTGNLIAILSVSEEYTPFQSLEDVANQAEYGVGTYSGSLIELTLKTSNNSLFQSLWGKVKQSKTSQKTLSQEEDWQHHMNKLDSGRYVFLVGETKIDLLMAERCDISKLPENFMSFYSSFTFPKLSPLSSLFEEELMQLTEEGMVSAWYKALVPKAKLCMEKTQKEKRRLTSKDFLSGFAACAVGIFIGVVTLIGETVMRRL